VTADRVTLERAGPLGWLRRAWAALPRLTRDDTTSRAIGLQ